MKIAYIDVNYKSGSTGQIVYDLIAGLNKKDNAIAFFGRGKKAKDGIGFKFGIDIETYFHAFLTRLTGLTGCFSFFSTKKLLHELKKYKPDIIHIHEIHGYFLNYIPLLNYVSKHNIPVVFTEHCEFNYTGRCGHSFECIGWKSSCGHCPHKSTYPKTLFFDFSKHMLKRKRGAFLNINNGVITAPSNWLLNRSKQSFIGQFKHILIRNGVNTDFFHYKSKEDCRKSLKLDLNKKIIICVASNLFGPYKGGDLLFDIARNSSQNEHMFVVIGKNKVPKKCPKNVYFLGPVYDKNVLANYYSAADAFLITSTIENFPTTCLEAACCGTPVVGFNVGGTAETVSSEHGIFVQFGDINGVVNAIKSVTSKKINRKEISEYYIKRYSKEEMSRQYNALYNEILKN